MMFVAGDESVRCSGLLSMSGVGAIIFVATTMPERMDRLTAFMNPERYKEGAGLQQMQALIAWGSGGIEGLGLGNGRQKMLYLPYAHTDFIFPMIGEELGPARQPARRLSLRRHHRLRNDDRAAREGSLRPAARLRDRRRCSRCRRR